MAQIDQNRTLEQAGKVRVLEVTKVVGETSLAAYDARGRGWPILSRTAPTNESTDGIPHDPPFTRRGRCGGAGSGPA
jgi:hypothetical protein